MDRLVNKTTFCDINTELTENVFKKLKILCVFGFGKSYIYVTDEDKVYGFGHNGSGCLGLGSADENIESPKLNPILSDRQLADIYFGFANCIGLTRSGQCYAWGNNEFGQLGTGLASILPKPQLIEDLADKRVVRISCGNAHNLVLTDSGQVYSWGRNTHGECGNKYAPNCYIPTQIEFDSQLHVKAISCGKTHSLALMANGLVYVWGNNSFGQLGRPQMNGMNKRELWSHRPKRVDTLANQVIVKAECGSNHNLLLTSEGDIYAFGHNDCGQVGNGSKDNQFCPIRINEEIKFKDIATSFVCDLSVGLSVADEYYVWGSVWMTDTRERKDVLKPMKTSGKSLFDVYANCAKRRITYKTIVISTDDKPLDQIINHTINTQNSSNTLTESLIDFTLNDSLMATNGHQMNESNAKKVPELVISSKKKKTKPKSKSKARHSSGNASNKSSIKSIVSEQIKPLLETPKHTVLIESNVLTTRLISSFNNPNDYDIRFKFEKQYIFGHKTLLRIRNEKFWQKCEQYLKNNSNKNEIEIKRYSYKTFFAFIQYLYTNGFTLIDTESTVDLLIFAKLYDELKLREICLQLLAKSIDAKNVCQLYSKAMDKKIPELEEYCIGFTAKHLKQICLSQEFRDFNDSLAKNLIIKAFKL